MAAEGRVNHRTARGFSLIEAAIALLIIFVILAVVIPILEQARTLSRRDQCATNQARLFIAWQEYLLDHDGVFPSALEMPGSAAWAWGGVVFNADDQAIGLDSERPLNAYLPTMTRQQARQSAPQIDSIAPSAMLGGAHVLYCPGDCGVTGPHDLTGTGRHTAFRMHGTSYRANTALFDAQHLGVDSVRRGVHRHEITTRPSQFLMLGDPLWFERAANTGRAADWHGDPARANMLFLDGSVRFEAAGAD